MLLRKLNINSIHWTSIVCSCATFQFTAIWLPKNYVGILNIVWSPSYMYIDSCTCSENVQCLWLSNVGILCYNLMKPSTLPPSFLTSKSWCRVNPTSKFIEISIKFTINHSIKIIYPCKGIPIYVPVYEDTCCINLQIETLQPHASSGTRRG